MAKRVILVLHGPNLKSLGKREPDIYGNTELEDIDKALLKRGSQLGVVVESFQSNHEGALIDKLEKEGPNIQGILINPAALTHYSYALRDALACAGLPVVEVHLSNIFAREPFRRHSVISEAVDATICGLGPDSYLFGLEALVKIINGR